MRSYDLFLSRLICFQICYSFSHSIFFLIDHTNNGVSKTTRHALFQAPYYHQRSSIADDYVFLIVDMRAHFPSSYLPRVLYQRDPPLILHGFFVAPYQYRTLLCPIKHVITDISVLVHPISVEFLCFFSQSILYAISIARIL